MSQYVGSKLISNNCASTTKDTK